MTSDPTAPAKSRAEFEQRRAKSRAAHSAKLDELTEDVRKKIDQHAAATSELNRARTAVQALRDERDNHLSVVLAKIDRRAELVPDQFRAALKATGPRIATSPHRAASLPAASELAVWVKPDGSLHTERIEQWKTAVTEAAEETSAISTRSRKAIERELKSAEKAVDEARAAEREAKEAVREARRRLHEFQTPA